MKRVLKVSLMAGFLALGIAAQAEALPSLRLIGCQGTICASTAISAPGAVVSVTFPPIVIGDYTLNGQGGATETPGIGFASNTGLSVVRTGGASATALTVWVEVTGYSAPVAPGFLLDTTHGATGAPTTGTMASITWQAWVSSTNLGTGYVGPVGPLAGPAVTVPGIPVGSGSNGAISCTPDAGGSCSVNGNAAGVASGLPYSMVTRTTYNIAIGDSHLYTNNSQAFVTAVPEPASMLLLGTGLVGLAAVARRRRRNNAN